MRRNSVLATLFAVLLCGTHNIASTFSQDGGLSVQAYLNWTIDPDGRVVDVLFGEDVALTAPLDRFRFAIDIVQPLARDSGAILGDLTGDGAADLLLATFDGVKLFYPGVQGKPTTFGNGIYLKHATTAADQDPFYDEEQSAYWVTGDIGDLDGDGQQEIVIGREIFSNEGTAQEPMLSSKYLLGSASNFDPAASLGDLNHDGKLDVVVSFGNDRTSYAKRSWIFWNQSTPGALQFSEQLLYEWPIEAVAKNRLAVADMNGDKLLDLVAGAGIYVNSGSAEMPLFDFTAPSPWSVDGGPSWVPSGAQGTNIFLIDATGDGLLDLYVSNLSSVLWQVLFYENVGTVATPQFRYAGPIVVQSTPLDNYYRGDSRPSFSGSRAFVAVGDIDSNGREDLLLSTDGDSSFGASTIVWNFSSATDPGLRFSYQDLYTYPVLNEVKLKCRDHSLAPHDFLCEPPNLFSVWADLTGDGLADVLRTDQWLDKYNLQIQERLNEWPIAVSGLRGMETVPSNQLATGWGAIVMDVNGDGLQDVVTGTEDGRLLYYQRLATNGIFADPVALTNDQGDAIDVGDQSWPTAIDLDGDLDLDLLVANYDGIISKVLCVNPGHANGFLLSSALASSEQDPLDITHVYGGGTIVPTLTTTDIDDDGLPDIVIGDVSGLTWLLHNTGVVNSPVFDLGPLRITQTTAGYLEIISAQHIRLHFALPVTPDETILTYHDLPLLGTAITGNVVITGAPIPTVTPTTTATPTGTDTPLPPLSTPTATPTPTPTAVSQHQSSLFVPFVAND